MSEKDNIIADLEQDFGIKLDDNFDASLTCECGLCLDELYSEVEAQLKKQLKGED